jgi:2-(1,2-epoxy-1,2-dihydrophenyl)acetyl-CoA isomerase
MAYEQLTVDVEGKVATLRLDNPSKMNALSLTLTAELIEALEALEADGDARALVITGHGRGFCSGADLSVGREEYERGEPPDVSVFLDGYNRLIPLIAEMPKPVVAAINGVAVGAGLSLALACDFRVAARSSSFGMAFVRIGLVPDSGAAYFLPRTVGMAQALELSMSGERIDAARALEMGLVNRVVADDECVRAAGLLAAELAELPTAAIGLTKRLFQETAGMTLSETLRKEAEVQAQAAGTEDHLEGVRAFLEKRPPQFRGR